jgi:hypothetical protein
VSTTGRPSLITHLAGALGLAPSATGDQIAEVLAAKIRGEHGPAPAEPAADFNALVEAHAARTLAEDQQRGGRLTQAAAYRRAAKEVAAEHPEAYWQHRKAL